MESILVATSVHGTLAEKPTGGSIAYAPHVQQFEALMQQTFAKPQEPFDRYTDEVAPLRNVERAVTLPDEIGKLGQNLSHQFGDRHKKFDETARKITDPYLLEVRDQIRDVVDFQRNITTLSITFKSIELSVQSCSQLFKMQG